jgi:hypothetical protein
MRKNNSCGRCASLKSLQRCIDVHSALSWWMRAGNYRQFLIRCEARRGGSGASFVLAQQCENILSSSVWIHWMPSIYILATDISQNRSRCIANIIRFELFPIWIKFWTVFGFDGNSSFELHRANAVLMNFSKPLIALSREECFDEKLIQYETVCIESCFENYWTVMVPTV